MNDFISKNLKYPPEALEKGIEGTVSLQYHVDKNGKVFKTKVIQALGYGCDEEAERVVRLLTFGVHKNFGKPYFIKRINVHFNLPAQPKVQINYVQTTKPKSLPTTASYSYTITLPATNK